MATDRPAGLPRLLYICPVSRVAGDNVLSLDARITIGVLSWDFNVSLAVVGDVSTVAMNRLRIELGPIRVMGGYDTSGADRPAERGLRRYQLETLGSDVVNARLQNAIQGKVHDFDSVIIDSLAAWPYRPAGFRGPIAFIARALATSQMSNSGLISGFRARPLKDYELGVMAQANRVFASPELAMALSQRGVAMRVLQCSFSPPATVRPSLTDPDFRLTQPRIGYLGYLSDAKNIASLNWFLDNIWSFAAQTLPDVEFHIIGKSPSESLRERVASFDSVQLHWGSDDRELLNLKCRLVIEPLMFEDHVDAKLINAMARGIPTVTTRDALNRAHYRLKSGIVAAENRETMVLAISRLMSDPKGWTALAQASMDAARGELPAFELAHCIRREMVKYRIGASES